MILRPDQIRLMRLGLPVTPCNLGGGGGSSSSSSSQATTTTNVDKRIAADGSLIAQDGGIVNYTATDAGAVQSAFEFAKAADASNASGFGKLLDTVDLLTSKTNDAATTMSSKFQDNVLQAFDQAKAAASGGIDQKTMIVLAIAATTGLIMVNRKKGS